MVRRLMASVCLALLLSGCWDRLEVNDLAIVTIIGLDKAEEGIRVTISLAVPAKAGGGGGGGDSSNPGSEGLALTYTGTGSSVTDAVKQLQFRVSRRLFWGHVRTMVLGDSLARSGVADALDYWSRHREPRMLMDVVVTPQPAAEFLLTQPRLERLLAEAVREEITINEQPHVTLNDFLRSLRTPTVDPVVPRVRLAPGTPSGKDVQVGGAAVFHGDRLVGYLDPMIARGLMWLRDEIRPSLISVAPSDGVPIGVEVIRGRTIVRPAFQGGKLRLNVYVQAEGDLVEGDTGLSLSRPETLVPLETAVANHVRATMKAAVQKLQLEFQADAGKLGEAVRIRAPLAWERIYRQKWADLFPEVPVEIAVNFQIRRTGEHGSPLTRTKG